MPKIPFSHALRAAGIAHALSHPVRLQILAEIGEEGSYVMALTEALERQQANISQHLAILRETGLVLAEREGMTVRYRLASPAVREILGILGVLADNVPPDDFVPRGRGRRRGGRGGGRGPGGGRRWQP
jgi:ArsR family transcriptional regulator